ncbi:MAG: hypothetical protein QNJ30_04780 [Kiloniellales bacterium]|nr:hypothetical protein [Kiloniellales bacterium]
MTRALTLPTAFAAGALVLTSSLATADAGNGLRLSEAPRPAVSVEVPALYPEGIEANPLTGNFLLGSIRQGTVYEVSPEGEARKLVEDRRLKSVVGIRVDPARGRLLVNSSDYGVAERSRPEDKLAAVALGIYDLKSGAPLHFIELSQLRPGEKKFANDLTLDAAGNAYVTDSLAAAIYKVTPEGEAEVFLANDRFRGEGFNLNGIVTHPDGYLLVAKKSEGLLFKVPLDDPEAFTEVKLPRAFVGTDGLVLAKPEELVVITNQASGIASDTVFTLKSEDAWASAEVTGSLATGDVYATTGVVKDGRVFVNYGRLNTLPASLKSPETSPLLERFEIREIGEVR